MTSMLRLVLVGVCGGSPELKGFESVWPLGNNKMKAALMSKLQKRFREVEQLFIE